VHCAQGQEQEIEAVIDTGFLTLPAKLIAALGLTWRGHAQAELADGSLHLFDAYVATVLGDDQARMVGIDATDTDPLVGMGLLHGYDLRIQVVEGGRVTIEVLPYLNQTTCLCLFGQRQRETITDCKGASVSHKMCQPPLGH
jgi:predicted aspartyl protease